MRYSIGSVSKQFLSCAILLLAEDGKLSLNDPVSRYLPGLTRAKEITIRQLLNHTSGYQDYYPLDYVAPFMRKDVTPDEMLKTWPARLWTSIRALAGSTATPTTWPPAASSRK